MKLATMFPSCQQYAQRTTIAVNACPSQVVVGATVPILAPLELLKDLCYLHSVVPSGNSAPVLTIVWAEFAKLVPITLVPILIQNAHGAALLVNAFGLKLLLKAAHQTAQFNL
jgi:hypothetical protein